MTQKPTLQQHTEVEGKKSDHSMELYVSGY